MNWRVPAAAAVVALGLAAAATVGPPWPDALALAWETVVAGVRIGGTAVLALVALAVVVLAAHQYRRWREYRPAIHLALFALAFVAGLAWWLGSPGIGSAQEPLSASQEATVRVAALAFLFLIALTVAELLDHARDDENEA